MKYKNVSRINMFTQGPTFPIKIKKKISVEDWEIFEKLADKNKKLWYIFWNISSDKERIVKKDICALYYLEEFVFPHLSEVMRKIVFEGETDNNGLSVILSLYLNMIPKNKCKECECSISDEDWIKKEI